MVGVSDPAGLHARQGTSTPGDADSIESAGASAGWTRHDASCRLAHTPNPLVLPRPGPTPHRPAATSVSDFFGALGRMVVRHRYLVVAVWIVGTVAAVATLPSLASQVNDNNGAFLPESAPSNQAALLAQPLIGPVTQSSVPVVAFTDGRPLDAADQTALRSLLANLRQVPTTLSVEYPRHLARRGGGPTPPGLLGVAVQPGPGRHPDRRHARRHRPHAAAGGPAGAPGRAVGHQRRRQAAVRQAGQGDPGRLVSSSSSSCSC